MEQWRVYRKVDKRFNHYVESYNCESRHEAISKLVDLSPNNPEWEKFSIQKFVNGEWASDFGAFYEAEEIIENDEEE